MEGTPRLSVLGAEHSQGWVTDREMVPGCARVRTKCTEKTSVDLWGQSGDPSELSGVTGPARGWPGYYTYHKISPFSLIGNFFPISAKTSCGVIYVREAGHPSELDIGSFHVTSHLCT